MNTVREKPSTALSGLYYPNKIARIVLNTLQDICGEGATKATLHMAGLSSLIGNFPPDNLEKLFDFAHFTAIQAALEEVYGVRGGRSLALRAGRTAFMEGLRNFGALAGAGDLAFRVLPLPAKLRIGLPAMASIFNNFSDQRTTVLEKEDHYSWVETTCPCCWGRQVDKPVCHMGTGLLLGGLHWVSGGLEFRVVQTRCMAAGDAHCEYVIYKEPLGER
ncbi:MAG: 4-vinyl reductase [Anaerolinea sp.]|nr:4-vinyl reductase [Anaerolinea sp.]MCC6974663.1 4-vinyl reductase [Anaerolineae bacterium]